ncbi:MAG: hypothetical protein NT062_31355 [Proteobacteria bacterium]|nr:hypothetical protein [Pseudomonadota bacterium]
MFADACRPDAGPGYLARREHRDLVVVGLLSSQVENFSIGATVAASLAITAADVAVGCILGACAPLRP